MAENTYKSNTFKKPEKEKKSKGPKSKFRLSFDFFKDPRFHLALGFFLLITSFFLVTAHDDSFRPLPRTVIVAQNSHIGRP